MWLPSYKREYLIPDILAGIGVACMLIPQALAYALLAEVSPIVGLYSSWMPLLVFACLTTSRHTAYGPDALGSLLVGLYMQKHSSLVDKDALASVYACVCGITLVTMGIFRIGFLDNVLSRPLLAGFVNAVAVIIIIQQLNTFFGISLHGEHLETSYDRIQHFFKNITEINWTTFLIGILCLTILVGHRLLRLYFPDTRILKFFIATLVVVVIGIVFSYTVDLKKDGVVLLGQVSTVFPVPWIPNLSLVFITENLLDSIVISIVGFVETIVAAKIYANKYNYQISPNRELVAMGMANLVGSFFHCYPVFGSLPRSALADSMGNKTQIYTFITSTFVLLTILFIAEIFKYLPQVVMSSIIIVAAVSLIEVHDFLFLWHIRAWKEIVLLITTFVVTLVLGVDIGIFVSIGISLLMVVKHTTLPHIAILGKLPEGNYVDIQLYNKAEIYPGIVIIRVDESLYFANIEQIKDMFKRIETFGSHLAHPTDKKEEVPIRAVIVHAKNIVNMDASAIQVMWEMAEEYRKNNVFCCFVKLQPRVKKPFIQAGIIHPIEGDRVFQSVSAAITYIQTSIFHETHQETTEQGMRNYEEDGEVDHPQKPLHTEKDKGNSMEEIYDDGSAVNVMEEVMDKENGEEN